MRRLADFLKCQRGEKAKSRSRGRWRRLFKGKKRGQRDEGLKEETQKAQQAQTQQGLTQQTPQTQQIKQSQESEQTQTQQAQQTQVAMQGCGCLAKCGCGGSSSGRQSVGGASQVSTAPLVPRRASLDSCDDLENEVFEGDDTLTPRNTRRHDHNNDDNLHASSIASSTLRTHARTLPESVLVLATLVWEDPKPHQKQGSNWRGHSRNKSDSHLPAAFTHTPSPPTHQPPTPPPSPQGERGVTFTEQAIQVAATRQVSPFRANREVAVTVEYTRVYGQVDGAYKNDSRPRGLVFVCNFAKFLDNKHSPRVGSERDYDNVLSLFRQMGYHTDYRRGRYCMTGDIKKSHFMQRLREFASDLKHTVLCSCVVVLMSHGSGPRTFYTSDNLEVDLLDVYQIFDNINCSNLKGKPKIFILQFCRGQGAAAPTEERPSFSLERPPRQLMTPEQIEEMVKRQVSLVVRDYVIRKRALQNHATQCRADDREVEHMKEHSRQASMASLTSCFLESELCQDGDVEVEAELLWPRVTDGCVIPSLPATGLQRYSDMYSIFSTSPGEPSHRHPTRGSLFIQALCHVFGKFAYQEEIDMLVRRISTYMAKTLQRDDPISVPRQTCESTNNGLDKLFYFNPFEMAQNRQFTI